MRLPLRIACLVATAVLLTEAVGVRAAELPSGLPAPLDLADRMKIEKVAKPFWEQCLQYGRQVVLSPHAWTCMDKSDGAKQLVGLEPAQFDPAGACDRHDLRRMPTGLIHDLVGKIDAYLKDANNPPEKKFAIKRNGIRIIGAAFCDDEVNLSDLDLPYQLALDRGTFVFGIRARKLTLGGNLSLDGTFIYSNLDISDSRIDGTLYGRNAFIRKTRVTDSQVRDAMRFDRSLLLAYFVLSHVKVGRGVDLKESDISTLSIRRSEIAERLDLSNSEASCRYHIENSDVNELRAIGAGFGRMIIPKPETKTASDPTQEKPLKLTRRTWSVDSSGEKRERRPHAKMREVAAAQSTIAEAEECDESIAQFEVLDRTTLRSVCLLNFRWIKPDTGPNAVSDKVAPTTVAFNGVTVAGNMTLNLWPDDTASDPKVGAEADRMLQFVGTKIGALFFDFNDNDRSYRTSIDQISIDRIYASDGGCATNSDERLWRLPNPAGIVEWVAKNNKPTLQTYSAFIKAFENAGALPLT